MLERTWTSILELLATIVIGAVIVGVDELLGRLAGA